MAQSPQGEELNSITHKLNPMVVTQAHTPCAGGPTLFLPQPGAAMGKSCGAGTSTTHHW